MRGLYRFGAFIGFLIMVQTHCKAQNVTRDSLEISNSVVLDSAALGQPKSTRLFKNNLFVEIGGSGALYDIGYERTIFKRNRVSLYTGVDLSYIGILINNYELSAGLCLLGFTYGNKHQLDIDLSMVWWVDFDAQPSSIAEQLAIKRNGSAGIPQLTFRSQNALGVGYRYNIKERWLVRVKALYMFRYDIVYESFSQWPWLEVGAGYKF